MYSVLWPLEWHYVMFLTYFAALTHVALSIQQTQYVETKYIPKTVLGNTRMTKELDSHVWKKIILYYCSWKIILFREYLKIIWLSYLPLGLLTLLWLISHIYLPNIKCNSVMKLIAENEKKRFLGGLGPLNGIW